MKIHVLWTGVMTFLAPLCTFGMTEADIPIAPVKDDIMASSEESSQVLNWSYSVFANKRAPHAPRIGISVRRQDHSVLHLGQSCIDTPMKIGTQEFQHGLGTHAVSEISLSLPKGAKTFQASAGVDNNFNTKGKDGSVQFIIEASGKELFRSATARGGNAPIDIKVDLPPDTHELVLKVNDAGDGVSCDQADWGDARVVFEDGSSLWADEDQQLFMSTQTPFSFVYNGVASSSLLSTWTHTNQMTELAGKIQHTAQWVDTKTGLRVSAVATVFSAYAAIEWVLFFENTGTQDTPILENIQAIDTMLATGYAPTPAVLHQLSGDVCGEQSFVPFDSVIEENKPLILAPVGGRSSSVTFPFFNLEYNGKGMIAAIGWTGQWQARFDRKNTGPTRFMAGLEKTHLILHPGERIRSPRILVMPWKGDLITAHQRFRRLLLFEYAPRINGHPLQMPLALQCFDRYNFSRSEWSTEAGQFQAARQTKAIGCDTHWLDAGWFPGNFPDGVGNWVAKPELPNGLKPLSDLCHTMGLRFLLWFEPERVAPGTIVAKEHPEFLLGDSKTSRLFNLGNPEARSWMKNLLSKRIQEFGIDTYRNDFNFDPLSFWRANDTPDRQGITEIRYVEGLYALWDALREKHPGLWIDNCASGGRRLDLEMLSRSVTLWRSDTGCAPGHADWDQTQAYGVSAYLPLFTSCSWDHDAYTLRSAATAGAICQFDYLNPAFSTNAAQAALNEVKENQKYWYGDFTPLTPYTAGSQALMAYQLHRPDLNSGIVLLFRRANSPYPAVEVSLKGLSPQQKYHLTFLNEQRAAEEKTLTGKEMMNNFELRIPGKKQSLLIRYRPE